MLSILFALAVMAQTPPAEWIVLVKHDAGLFAVDRASVRRDGDVVVYSGMVARHDGGVQLGVRYAYQLAEWTIDCRAMTFQTAHDNEYAADGTHLVINKPIIPTEPPEALPPRSTIHQAATAVCNDKWGDQPVFPSAVELYRATRRQG